MNCGIPEMIMLIGLQFQFWFRMGNLNINSTMGYFVQFANNHDKPIMIMNQQQLKLK